MKAPQAILGRIWLPGTVFLAVWTIHFVWSGLFPESDPAQDRWLTVTQEGSNSWLASYVEMRLYWLGYCYALSLSFAAVAVRRYLKCRAGSTRNAAIGGITISGVLGAVGCFLLGCCGSPMIGVYLSLFGAAFLPLAGPLVAAFTTAIVGLLYWRMQERPALACCGDDK